MVELKYDKKEVEKLLNKPKVKKLGDLSKLYYVIDKLSFNNSIKDINKNFKKLKFWDSRIIKYAEQWRKLSKKYPKNSDLNLFVKVVSKDKKMSTGKVMKLRFLRPSYNEFKKYFIDKYKNSTLNKVQHILKTGKYPKVIPPLLKKVSLHIRGKPTKGKVKTVSKNRARISVLKTGVKAAKKIRKLQDKKDKKVLQFAAYGRVVPKVIKQFQYDKYNDPVFLSKLNTKLETEKAEKTRKLKVKMEKLRMENKRKIRMIQNMNLTEAQKQAKIRQQNDFYLQQNKTALIKNKKNIRDATVLSEINKVIKNVTKSIRENQKEITKLRKNQDKEEKQLKKEELKKLKAIEKKEQEELKKEEKKFSKEMARVSKLDIVMGPPKTLSELTKADIVMKYKPPKAKPKPKSKKKQKPKPKIEEVEVKEDIIMKEKYKPPKKTRTYKMKEKYVQKVKKKPKAKHKRPVVKKKPKPKVPTIKKAKIIHKPTKERKERYVQPAKKAKLPPKKYVYKGSPKKVASKPILKAKRLRKPDVTMKEKPSLKMVKYQPKEDVEMRDIIKDVVMKEIKALPAPPTHKTPKRKPKPKPKKPDIRYKTARYTKGKMPIIKTPKPKPKKLPKISKKKKTIHKKATPKKLSYKKPSMAVVKYKPPAKTRTRKGKKRSRAEFESEHKESKLRKAREPPTKKFKPVQKSSPAPPTEMKPLTLPGYDPDEVRKQQQKFTESKSNKEEDEARKSVLEKQLEDLDSKIFEERGKLTANILNELTEQQMKSKRLVPFEQFKEYAFAQKVKIYHNWWANENKGDAIPVRKLQLKVGENNQPLNLPENATKLDNWYRTLYQSLRSSVFSSVERGIRDKIDEYSNKKDTIQQQINKLSGSGRLLNKYKDLETHIKRDDVCDKVCIIMSLDGDAGKGKIKYNVTTLEHDKTHCLGKKVKDRKLKPLPTMRSDRDLIYVSGPSGAGKTTWAKLFMEEYHEKYPNNVILTLSKKPWKPQPGVKSKPLKITMATFRKLDLDKLRDSLIVVDDYENLGPKRIQQAAKDWLKEIMNLGREYNISLILITHEIMNYRQTKQILNEANKVVIFPKSGARYQYRNFLKQYMGFNKSTVESIMSSPSRWVMLHRDCPLYTLSENEINIVD